MPTHSRPFGVAFSIFAAFLITGTEAQASVVAVGQGTFASSPVIDFAGLATGTEVNGLVVNGITFNYLIGGVPTNGQVGIDDGPGTTNNVAVPNIVSIGNNTEILALTLSLPVTAIGYGYAILATTNITNATNSHFSAVRHS